MLAPPFVITEDQIDELIALLRQALERTAAGLEGYS
jgi:adenosylmethionine-8-amino-7-oxononanoate aminotransferase